MPSVVFDASSLVGALIKAASVPERALLLARRHDILCMTTAIEAEIREVFARPRFKAAWESGRAERIFAIVMGSAEWHSPTQAVTDCRDAKDNKYLELALAAGANLGVASDNDLLDLHPWRGIPIIRPAQYVERFAIPDADGAE